MFVLNLRRAAGTFVFARLIAKCSGHSAIQQASQFAFLLCALRPVMIWHLWVGLGVTFTHLKFFAGTLRAQRNGCYIRHLGGT